MATPECLVGTKIILTVFAAFGMSVATASGFEIWIAWLPAASATIGRERYGGGLDLDVQFINFARCQRLLVVMRVVGLIWC